MAPLCGSVEKPGPKMHQGCKAKPRIMRAKTPTPAASHKEPSVAPTISQQRSPIRDSILRT
eukprot:6334613-Prorocentrum_lima.AAC.1